MSNHPRRRPAPPGRLNGQRRPPATGTASPPDVAMCYGMTETADPAEVEQAKLTTHDQLVEQLGDRRRGPVYWRIVSGPEIPETLNTLADDKAQAHYEGETDRDDAFAGMRRWVLEHPDAVLVIAQAAAVVTQ